MGRTGNGGTIAVVVGKLAIRLERIRDCDTNVGRPLVLSLSEAAAAAMGCVYRLPTQLLPQQGTSPTLLVSEGVLRWK